MVARSVALWALDMATEQGASYAEVRLHRIISESITMRDGIVVGLNRHSELGMGVRVLVEGAWGFAGNPDLTGDKVTKAVKRAIAIARASARAGGTKVKLAPVEKQIGEWCSPCEKDPWTVPLEEKIDLLQRCDDAMAAVPGVKVRESILRFWREHKLLATSIGTLVEQTIYNTTAGVTAKAVDEGDFQVRNYPMCFGGNWRQAGYEAVEKLDLLKNAGRVAEEAVQLLKADLAPTGKADLILGGNQLALQVHESVGHPIELDRVLGTEADFAGTSFLSPDMLNNFTYGSKVVNIVADSVTPGGLGTFGYDDEGVPAGSHDIVKEGRFIGFLTSRETAADIGTVSMGAMRADGWNNIPLIRMVNVSLLPGDCTYDEIIESTERGLLITCNRSWSIDDKRLNFQFGGEIGWWIEKGRIVKIVKNPTYNGITPVFWRSCDAIANRDSWKMWGFANCGKGRPAQAGRVGHGVSCARFRNVEIGV
ncbi:MAG: TldD/PmbA family protein [bacterium]|nr:TldD/PmbA family protein [bacterium]